MNEGTCWEQEYNRPKMASVLKKLQKATFLHSNPTPIPLLVTTFLTLFLNVFSLQGKDVSKLAGNWF